MAGVFWALSFPLPGVAGFAWIAPGLLLAVTGGIPAGLAFRVGYVAASVHYLISLSWLRHIPFPAGAYTGWLALSFFLALLPPLWALGCWRLARRLGAAPEGTFDGRALAERLDAAGWWRLNLWFLACAAAWVSWEMLLARLFGGFPWNLLGASQYRMLPLIQIASFTGVYGVSFLVVWFSVSLLTAVALLARDPDRPSAWRRPLVFPALMVVAAAGGGFLNIQGSAPPPRRLAVALVQPSIPQTVIFDPTATTNRFETLLRLTESALVSKPDLVLWPEASLPGGLSKDDFERLTAAIRGAGAWMIFGSDELETTTDAQGREVDRAYNSAFLVDPAGQVVASYRKRRLVMFGEYIPFGRWLPFLRRLAPIGEGFQAGDRPVTFRMETLAAGASVLICFEDNFPQQARQHAVEGVDFLVNITNDAWFGESAAQWQHAANAVFRAIENGLPLIRCANNGISGWVDPHGRLHSARLAEGRDPYEAGFEVTSLVFGATHPALYRRFGDVFGWLCVAGTILALNPRPRVRRPIGVQRRGSR